MSAFALRKRLLKEKEAAASLTPDVQDALVPQNVADNPALQRKRQKRSRVESSVVTSTQSASSTLSYESSSVQNLDENSPENPEPIQTSVDTSEIDDANTITAPAGRSVVQFSNFKPCKANYQARKNGVTVLKLVAGERLVLLGNYGIRVVSGDITLQGAVLKASPRIFWVDAPHCHGLPVIRCPEEATIELHPDHRSETLRLLGQLSPLFRKLWNESSTESQMKQSFQILYTSSDGPKRTPIQDLVAPPEWNRETARLLASVKSNPLSIMITGPKSSGKSTFGKLLANRFITEAVSVSRNTRLGRVAVLDLDPGQPEYCLPGQIALVCLEAPVLGPSFCHDSLNSGFKVLRSHTIASVSPSSDPELYIEAAEDLIVHYRNRLASCPIIVNTPGWIQGTGLDLIGSLITSLRPTEVVYMSTTGPAEAVEYLQAACIACPLVMLPSQAAQYGARTAAQLRAMHAMAYFHTIRETTKPDLRPHWNSRPLTADAPWLVNYSGTVSDRGIYGIMCYDYQAPLELLLDTINGSIVAIVEIESDRAFRAMGNMSDTSFDLPENHVDDEKMAIDACESEESLIQSLQKREDTLIRSTPEGLPIIDSGAGTSLDPRFSQTIGLALVRGVDVENKALHLLSPILASEYQAITSRGSQIVLVSGKFDSPIWAYTEDLYYQERGQDEGILRQGDATVDETRGSREERSYVDGAPEARDTAETTPWIEVLHGDQRRSVGSKVWRVRRDLGRSTN